MSEIVSEFHGVTSGTVLHLLQPILVVPHRNLLRSTYIERNTIVTVLGGPYGHFTNVVSYMLLSEIGIVSWLVYDRMVVAMKVL